jgi:hypothetical protein
MKRCIIFFRGDHFYPTEYPASYSDWQAEADRNPGTTKIMDGVTGKLLWLPTVEGRSALQREGE